MRTRVGLIMSNVIDRGLKQVWRRLCVVVHGGGRSDFGICHLILTSQDGRAAAARRDANSSQVRRTSVISSDCSYMDMTDEIIVVYTGGSDQ